MSLFDTNQWYQITIPIYGKMSLVGLHPEQSKPAAAVFFQTTNTSSPAQHWQIFPTANDTYILRSRASSPGAYLAVRQDGNTDAKTTGSTAIMRRRETASDEVFWKLERFRNGGYRLTNAANATNWNLHANNASSVTMTNKATGDRDDERFSFTAFDERIDDVKYSSVQLPDGAFARATGGSSPPKNPKSGSSSGGLSGGEKAAIGASIGAAVLIAIVAGVLLLLRRRRRKQAPIEDAPHPEKPEVDASQRYLEEERATAPVQIKYGHGELQTEEPPQELEGSRTVVTSRSPVELPAEHTERHEMASR